MTVLGIVRKELLLYFTSFLFWAVAAIFLVLCGFLFYTNLDFYVRFGGMNPVRGLWQYQLFDMRERLLVLIPLLTMRLFAEERRSGTIETLLTTPVGNAGVVLAKFSAAMVAYVAMWAPTVLYVVVMRKAGDVDVRVVATSYLGVFGIGAQYIAIGTMMSAVARSQLVALILSTVFILGFFLLGLGEFVLDEGAAREVCAYVSVWSQMGELSKGIVDLRRITLDATLVALPLYTTTRLVDAWRWG